MWKWPGNKAREMEQKVESSSDPQLNHHQSRLKGSQTRKWSREGKDGQ